MEGGGTTRIDMVLRNDVGADLVVGARRAFELDRVMDHVPLEVRLDVDRGDDMTWVRDDVAALRRPEEDGKGWGEGEVNSEEANREFGEMFRERGEEEAMGVWGLWRGAQGVEWGGGGVPD